MVEDFAVAVPAAVGGGAAAGRVVPADVAEDLMVFAAVAQVQQLQVRVALAVARGEAEAAHSVHLHEGQVELLREREGGGGANNRLFVKTFALKVRKALNGVDKYFLFM